MPQMNKGGKFVFGESEVHSDGRVQLAENGISVVIPDADDIEAVNSIIFHELCIGKIKDESRKKYYDTNTWRSRSIHEP